MKRILLLLISSALISALPHSMTEVSTAERLGATGQTDVVVLTGGLGGLGTFTSVDVWDPLGQCQVQLPQLATGRYYHSSHYTYSDGQLLLCGVKVTGVTSCSHWVNGTFQHHSQPLEERSEHVGVTMGDHIYLAGGAWGKYRNVKSSMEILSGGKTWARGADMQQGRIHACGVATSNTTFIVIGGAGAGGHVLSSVEEFNTVTGTWRNRAAMPGGGRVSPKCANIGGDILVAGGHDDFDYLDSALLYRVDTNTWRTAAKMNQKKWFGEMVVVNGRILYLGGWNEKDASDTIEEYDQEGDFWTILDMRLNRPREYFGASVVPRSLVGC